MLFPSRAPKKLKPRGDFDAEDFRRKLFQFGAQVTWQQCAQCPCGRKLQDVASDMDYTTPLAADYLTGEPQTGCLACKSTGYIVHDSQEIRALMQDMRYSGRRFNPGGEVAAGTARVSLLPEHKVSLGDRLLVKNSAIVVREAKKRTASVTEALRFPIVSQTMDLQAGPTVVRTLFGQKADASNVSAVADTLVEGVDYVVANGILDWSLGITSGRAPALNAYYTISYFANPSYLIVDLGFGVRDSWDGMHRPENSPLFQRLPTMAVARQEWLGTHGGMP